MVTNDPPEIPNKDYIEPHTASAKDPRVVANYAQGKVEIYYSGSAPTKTQESVANTYLLSGKMKDGTKIRRILLPEEDITDQLD